MRGIRERVLGTLALGIAWVAGCSSSASQGNGPVPSERGASDGSRPIEGAGGARPQLDAAPDAPLRSSVSDPSGPGRVSCNSQFRGTTTCELLRHVCCLFVDFGLSFQPQDAQCILRGPGDSGMSPSDCLAIAACDSDADCSDGEKCLFEAPTAAGRGSHCGLPGQDAGAPATGGAAGVPDGGPFLYPLPNSVWCVGSTSPPSQCGLPGNICCLQPASPSDGYSASCTPPNQRGISCTGLIECDGDEDCSGGTRCTSWSTATVFGKRCESIPDGGTDAGL